MSRDVQSKAGTGRGEEDAASGIVPGNQLFADPHRDFWFVEAGDEQRSRFRVERIWENGEPGFNDLVVRMKPGDRIAIKRHPRRCKGAPFDHRGEPQVMRIEEIGTITASAGDGTTVRVDWEPLQPPRDWYFFTYVHPVARANRVGDLARRLILFAFAGVEQDYQCFLEYSFFTKYAP